MNKRRIPQQVSIGGTRISNASVVNVADEEKQEGCTSHYKDERGTCESTKTTVSTGTVT